MESKTESFSENARQALGDAKLRDALDRLAEGFPAKRLEAVGRLPEFEALCDQARDIKHHVLGHLDFYLEAFEARVTEAGGTVHWCRNAAEARTVILKICKQAGAKPCWHSIMNFSD